MKITDLYEAKEINSNDFFVIHTESGITKKVTFSVLMSGKGIVCKFCGAPSDFLKACPYCGS